MKYTHAATAALGGGALAASLGGELLTSAVAGAVSALLAWLGPRILAAVRGRPGAARDAAWAREHSLRVPVPDVTRGRIETDDERAERVAREAMKP